MRTLQDKMNIHVLSGKQKRKDSHKYKDVFIFRDQSIGERALSINLKTLVSVLKEKGCDVELHGNRVMSNSRRNSDTKNFSEKSWFINSTQ